jgi:hypothetical protein
MLRIAAALAVCAFSVAACSDGSGSPTGGNPASVLEVVAVYRPVCGPEPRPTAGASASRTAPACPEQPLVGIEVVVTRADGSLAGRDTTSAAGRVVMSLDPGTYTITAEAAPPPRITPRPTTVTVGTEPMPTVTLVYESSMQ